MVHHPPYSPDLVPSDYYLFRSPEAAPAQEIIQDYNDLKGGLCDFLLSWFLSFKRKGIETLPSKWLGVFDNDGDYIVDL